MNNSSHLTLHVKTKKTSRHIEPTRRNLPAEANFSSARYEEIFRPRRRKVRSKSSRETWIETWVAKFADDGGALPARPPSPSLDRVALPVTLRASPARLKGAGERALIAAKMASLLNGSNQFAKKAKGDEGDVATSPTISLNQAAEFMGVSRDVGVSAKTILDHGSEIDIAAAREHRR